MGCHTWVYKKVSAISEDTKRKEVADTIENLENSCILTRPKDLVIAEMAKYYRDMHKDFPECSRYNKPYTEKTYNRDVQKAKNDIERLKQEGFNYLLHLLRGDTSTIQRHKGEIYYFINSDNPFRLCEYTEAHFYDCEKLLGYLKKHSSNVSYWDSVSESYIPGYTDKLEQRIRDFFNKHGKDNLYFEFG